MKKIVASASLVTLGLLSVQSAQAQADSKPWNVSATLRGFYDDNYATLPSRPSFPGGPTRRGSLGFEISPRAGYNINLDQTTVGLSYQYGMKYYEDRKNNSADHSHQADLKVEHAFSERYKASVRDSFVIAQEPFLIDPAVVTNPLRTDGNNIRNTVNLKFSAQLSEQFTTEFGYDNNVYDYQQEGAGSRSALLDRVEHVLSANLRWNVLENTTALVGYQFSLVDQTSTDNLDAAPAAAYLSPSQRDNHSHYFFIGADQSFTSQLTGSARLGFQYTEYPNAASNVENLSPYVDISVNYQYTKDSYASIGLKHSHNQTDVAAVSSAAPTVDAETTTVYGSISHKITPLLTGILTAQYQSSSFNGGVADGKVDNLFDANFKLAYEINKWLNAETGYIFDRLDSDLPGRSYYRHQVFIGIRAAY